jgi:TatA/E family protein of Tat protein translocase
MSFNEIIVLLIIALVLFGPDDLPDIARALGKIVYEIKKITGDMTKEFQEAVNTPSNMLKKTLDDALYATPKKSGQEAKKEAAKETAKETETETSSVASATTTTTDSSNSDQVKPNIDDEELLTYDDDPLAELPKDMVSYEK